MLKSLKLVTQGSNRCSPSCKQAATVTSIVTKHLNAMSKVTANFEKQTIHIGLDVHKHSWNAGISLGDMIVFALYPVLVH